MRKKKIVLQIHIFFGTEGVPTYLSSTGGKTDFLSGGKEFASESEPTSKDERESEREREGERIQLSYY